MSHAASRIPSLDGLRAIAFLVVLIAHLGLDGIVPGGFGVTIFFFLSGYLITTLMLSEFDAKGTMSLFAFYVRRTLRIFPPLYVSVLVALAIYGVLDPASLSAGGVLASLGFYANYYLAHVSEAKLIPGMSVLWSLAVEEHFYLIYPFCFQLLRRYVKGAAQHGLFLLGVCGLVLVWRVVITTLQLFPSDHAYMCTDARIDSILFGGLLAVWKNPVRLPEGAGLGSLRRKWILIGLALGTLLLTFTIRSPFFRDTLRYTLQGLALMPIFYYAVRDSHSRLFAWLNGRLLEWIGDRSYAMYLIHNFAIVLVAQTLTSWGPLARAPVVALVTVGFAVVVRLVVERPAQRLRPVLLRLKPAERVQLAGRTP